MYIYIYIYIHIYIYTHMLYGGQPARPSGPLRVWSAACPRDTTGARSYHCPAYVTFWIRRMYFVVRRLLWFIFPAVILRTCVVDGAFLHQFGALLTRNVWAVDRLRSILSGIDVLVFCVNAHVRTTMIFIHSKWCLWYDEGCVTTMATSMLTCAGRLAIR